MAGFGSRTSPAAGAHDPLFVRVLAMEGSGGPAVLLMADVLHVPEFLQEHAARLIHERTGIGREQIQFGATHTHGGPVLAEGSAYSEQLATLCADAVEEAWRSRREAYAAVGTDQVFGIGKNRRHPDGPVDHDVTVLRIDGADGRSIATLINYSCHPTTLGPDNLLYTADYPGVTCALVDEAVDGIAIFSTGAQGDVNPGGYSAEGSMIGQVVPWRNYESATRYGTEVARAALAIRERLQPAPVDRVWGRSRVLELARKPLPEPAEAQAIIETANAALAAAQASGHQDEIVPALLTAAYAQLIADQAAQWDRVSPVRVRISALALGPVVHVGIAGELFAELGLQIKAALGQGHTMVSVLCDGSAGYIPTRAAFAEGGYEPNASLHLPGGGEEITEAAIALARD